MINHLLHRGAFIAILAGSGVCSLAASAEQSGKVPRVGILWIAPKPVVASFHEAFRQGLRELGYIEGQTIAIEARCSENDGDGSRCYHAAAFYPHSACDSGAARNRNHPGC